MASGEDIRNVIGTIFEKCVVEGFVPQKYCEFMLEQCAIHFPQLMTATEPSSSVYIPIELGRWHSSAVFKIIVAGCSPYKPQRHVSCFFRNTPEEERSLTGCLFSLDEIETAFPEKRCKYTLTFSEPNDHELYTNPNTVKMTLKSTFFGVKGAFTDLCNAVHPAGYKGPCGRN